jgi:hypothetical protein
MLIFDFFSGTGTQGLKGAKDRSRVPYDLGKEILEAIGGTNAEL